MSGPAALAFGIWMLLTADFSLSNALLGLIGSLLAARFFRYRFTVRQLLYLMLSFVVRTFQAVGEAVLLILLPHRCEQFRACRLHHARNPWAVFTQVLILTFTPKTLVTRPLDRNTVEVHELKRRKEP